MSELHTATFTWPSTDPAEVVLTGTFDDWTKSVPLTKTETGFTGTIQIPWGSEVQYKFVVDGNWVACQEQPVTLDGSNDNNVYTAPPKPAHAPEPETLVAAAAPGPTSVPETTATVPEAAAIVPETSTIAPEADALAAEPVAAHTEAVAPSPLPPTDAVAATDLPVEEPAEPTVQPTATPIVAAAAAVLPAAAIPVIAKAEEAAAPVIAQAQEAAAPIVAQVQDAVAPLVAKVDEFTAPAIAKTQEATAPVVEQAQVASANLQEAAAPHVEYAKTTAIPAVNDAHANVQTSVQSATADAVPAISSGVTTGLDAAQPHIDAVKAAVAPHVEAAQAAITPHVEAVQAAIAPHVETAKAAVAPHVEAIATSAPVQNAQAKLQEIATTDQAKAATDTVAATEGTGNTTLGYVLSGVGAAIHTITGIDPVNADKIAVEEAEDKEPAVEAKELSAAPLAEPVPAITEAAPKEPPATTALLEPSHPDPEDIPAAYVVVSAPTTEEDTTTTADTATTATATTDTIAPDASKATTKIDTLLAPSASLANAKSAPVTPVDKARFSTGVDSTPTTPITGADRKKRHSLFGKIKSVFMGSGGTSPEKRKEGDASE